MIRRTSPSIQIRVRADFFLFIARPESILYNMVVIYFIIIPLNPDMRSMRKTVLLKMIERKSPRGRSLTAPTLQMNARPERRPWTARAAVSPLSFGRMEMPLDLLLMVNMRSWMMDLTSTKLVGTTSNTWMRTEENMVRMITTDMMMQPGKIRYKMQSLDFGHIPRNNSTMFSPSFSFVFVFFFFFIRNSLRVSSIVTLS